MRKHIPNIITVGRIIILPLFIVNLWRSLNSPDTYSLTWPIILFVIMLLSDWLDGWLARRYEWVTPTGKWLDPLADKMVDFWTWPVLLVFLFTENNIEFMTAQAMVGYWLLYLALIALVVFRFGQDSYSQRWYKNHGGQSNIWGKIKFNSDMLGIFLGMIGIRLSQVRGTNFHAPMLMMISCLSMASICAYASLMIKQGKRPLPGSSESADSMPSLIDGIAQSPQPFD